MRCASICRRPLRCLKPLPPRMARRSSTRSSAPRIPSAKTSQWTMPCWSRARPRASIFRNLYCIPAEFSWNDLGSWASLYEYQLETRLRGDAEGNVADTDRTHLDRGQRQLHLQPEEICRAGGRGESGDCGYRRRAADRAPRPLAGRGQDREGAEHHRAQRADLARCCLPRLHRSHPARPLYNSWVTQRAHIA